MQKVYTSEDRLLVEHVKNILENENIRCVLKNTFLSSGAGELPPLECWLELWVTDDKQANQARTLIQQLLQAQQIKKKDWQCPNCGEMLEGQFTACWKCGFET